MHRYLTAAALTFVHVALELNFATWLGHERSG